MRTAETASYSEQIEGLSENAHCTVEQLASQYRQLVYGSMLAARSAKYRYFLWALRAAKYLSCQPKRGAFLENYYALMRHMDDIVDGDVPLPEGYGSAKEYMERKIEFSKGKSKPQDSSEILLQHCFAIGESFGESFHDETADILGSLHFDAVRRNPESSVAFSREVLQHHFHLLDIRGTINTCLKLADEKHMTSTDLEPLGNASRIHYTLRDFDEDIAAGLINIPEEDMQKLNISMADLQSSTSPSVRTWLAQEAQKGLRLLDEHREKLPILRMRKLIRTALWVVYERPASNCFAEIASHYTS